ncbi:MAG: hypothetical protein KC486_17405, partial [Myxococcales bacterium]|nr:hypothetical protein [Myxococcales bacterium]
MTGGGSESANRRTPRPAPGILTALRDLPPPSTLAGLGPLPGRPKTTAEAEPTEPSEAAAETESESETATPSGDAAPPADSSSTSLDAAPPATGSAAERERSLTQTPVTSEIIMRDGEAIAVPIGARPGS